MMSLVDGEVPVLLYVMPMPRTGNRRCVGQVVLQKERIGKDVRWDEI
jgi:hypothetical protein